MNRLLLQAFLILCLGTPEIKAQESTKGNYPALLTEGKWWKYERVTDGNPNNPQPGPVFTLRVAGDTLVGDRLCKRLAIAAEKTPDKVTYMAAYEEGKKVYRTDEQGSPRLLMDFDLSENLVTGNPDYPPVSSASADSILVHGTKRRRLVVDPGVHSMPERKFYYVVEGIGVSWTRFLYPWMPEPFRDVRMIACYEGETCVFEAADFKGPGTGLRTAAALRRTSPEEGYDLSGRRLPHPRRRGVCVEQGRKVVR